MRRFTGRLALQVLFVVLTAAILFVIYGQRSWIAEDAHITLRTVANFFDGYGLRWNVDERVQTYTHPLWLMLILAAFAITREYYFTVASLGLISSVGAYMVLAWHFRSRPLLVLFGLFLPCATSVFLLRYSTSGLENSVTILLIALFAVSALSEPADDVRWGRLGLFAGLAALNRLDTILLMLPALAFLIVRYRRSVAWVRLAAGFVPLALWMAFCLFYYGFLMPNTAYAKLSPAIPKMTYIISGMFSLADPWLNDPVSSAALLLGAATTALCWYRGWYGGRQGGRHGDEYPLRVATLGSGSLLYIAYIVWIGGDFMPGRFWVAPVFLMLIVIVAGSSVWVEWARASARWKTLAVVAVLLALAGIFRGRSDAVRDQVLQTRIPSRVTLRTKDFTWRRTYMAKKFVSRALRARRNHDAGWGPSTFENAAIGIGGFAAGPGLKVIDKHGLGDPLMARLAPMPAETYLPGHYRRKVPDGYNQARATGDLTGMHPALAEYYGHLRTVISGPLGSSERLTTIVRFHLGSYDDLLAEYESRPVPPAEP